MGTRPSLQRVVIVAAVLGILVPIVLLIRTLMLGRLFGTTLERLFYPGSIFLFNVSHHSSFYGLTAFALSLVATAALYAISAMILFGIIRGVLGAWNFARRH
jgi:hypothetical protein